MLNLNGFFNPFVALQFQSFVFYREMLGIIRTNEQSPRNLPHCISLHWSPSNTLVFPITIMDRGDEIKFGTKCSL